MRPLERAGFLRDLVRGLLDASDMRSLLVVLIAGVSLAVAAGCGPTTEAGESSTGATMGADLDPGEDSEGDVGDETLVDDGPIVAADDSVPGLADTATVMAAATKVRTTANVNLRKDPSTSASILAVIPEGTTVSLLAPTPTSGFYKVTYNGMTGYAHSSYVTPVGDDEDSTGGAADVDGPASPASAIARAKAAVGFSYWWGGGAWLESGPTSSSRGSCTGNCPSCSHSGHYGADCSGLVAKAWQFGTKTLSVSSHPYSTADFASDAAGRWSTVSRSSLRAADALVYRSGSAGHIAIYEKGDGWGAPTVYECRSCAYGCVHNARSFSGYKGIRRAGF